VQWHPGDRGMAKLADALLAQISAPAGSDVATSGTPAGPTTTILDEHWDSSSSTTWLPQAPTTEVKDGLHAAKFTVLKADSSNVSSFVFSPSAIAGHWITVHTRVKGDGISTRPKPYNGPKIVFHLHCADGKDSWPQADALPDGTFDWKDVDWRLRVPDNVATAEFGIGLENVQGTLWMGPVTITASPGNP
jgi:hypothetical protein